jgi:Invasion associated locus B (IalB) protein
MKRVIVVGLVLIATPGNARDALGIYGQWGAFRDARPYRCFAIAQPSRRGQGAWQPFASIAHWPAQRVRGQIHVRLSRERRADAPVSLTIGNQRFPMVAGPVNAWAPHPRVDAAIVAAVRSGEDMTVSSVSVKGTPFSDRYRLQGAASAIDAAALGCARRR